MQNEILFPNIDDIDTLSQNGQVKFPSIAGNFSNKIHIGIKQRNARSSITSIENFPSTCDLVSILKKMKKTFHCSGSIQGQSSGKYIQLSGDQRLFVKKFLIDFSLADEDNIIIHGY